MYKIITDTFINYMKASYKKSQSEVPDGKAIKGIFYMQHNF